MKFFPLNPVFPFPNFYYRNPHIVTNKIPSIQEKKYHQVYRINNNLDKNYQRSPKNPFIIPLFPEGHFHHRNLAAYYLTRGTSHRLEEKNPYRAVRLSRNPRVRLENALPLRPRGIETGSEERERERKK